MSEPWTHGWAQLSSVKLHYVEAGASKDEERPLVVLLHGFPEFWYSWRHQIPALAEAGMHVVAPDMRGFNLSDKPPSVSDYRIETLAADVEELIRYFGRDRAHVIGHDWGGMVAWWFAMHHGERLERLSILNAPHPQYFETMFANLKQVRKSWYILLFQLPFGLAERAFVRNDFAGLRDMLARAPRRRGAFTDEDIERYVEAFSGDAPRATMSYYRALVRRNPFGWRARLRPIARPTQVIWGAKDRAIGLEYSKPAPQWATDLRYDLVDDASHWVQVDRPERVNGLLLEFHQGLPDA